MYSTYIGLDKMFRVNRIFGYNTISRDLRTYFFVRYSSTEPQEKDIEIKANSNHELSVSNAKQSFEDYFSKANDIPSLLKKAASKYQVDYAFKAFDLLAAWHDVKNINFEEVQKDANYSKLVSVVEKTAHSQHASEIIGAIKNLQKLGVPDANFLIESLENDLLWNVRKVSVHSLLLILNFQRDHLKTDRQKKVLEQTVLGIEKRWTEVKLSRDICLIYILFNHFNANFLSSVDDLTIQLAGSMNIIDLSKVIIALSTSKRRPTPVLRSLAFHMFKNAHKLSPKQISNLAYAMNTLSFPDEALLGKLSSDFLSQIDKVDQPSIIGALLVSMGQMRWRDKTLIDALGAWISRNIDICRHSDLASFILTMASVNYTPSNIDDLMNLCTPRLNLETVTEKSQWVDIVWSLTVLERATQDQMSSVLTPSFVNTIPSKNPSYIGTYLKLLNIVAAAAAAAAQSSSGSRTKPKLNIPSVDVLLTRSRKDVSLQNFVQKVLHNFLPPPKYLKENVKTEMGFTVDAELIMDRNCKPLPLTEYSTAFGDIESLKPLPEGAHRVALMIWNFKDYTIGSHSLTGQNSLAVNLLIKNGYKVVHIPYYDINKKEKTITSVQYFEKRIKETVNS